MGLTFVLTSRRTFNDGAEPVCVVVIEVKAKLAQFIFHINPKNEFLRECMLRHLEESYRVSRHVLRPYTQLRE